MPTKKQVWEEGEKVDDWACDWDPEEQICRSNGGIENIVLFEGKKYSIVSNWDDEIFNEDEIISSINEDE
jgi:hypothetical protein